MRAFCGSIIDRVDRRFAGNCIANSTEPRRLDILWVLLAHYTYRPVIFEHLHSNWIIPVASADRLDSFLLREERLQAVSDIWTLLAWQSFHDLARIEEELLRQDLEEPFGGWQDPWISAGYQSS